MIHTSHRLARSLAPLVVVLVAACGGGGGGVPDDPGINGANLPSGGRPSNPAGKYVGRFLTEGWRADAPLASFFSVCETQMVYIDGDLSLVVGDENDPLVDSVRIPLEDAGGTYTGHQVSTEEDGAQLTVDLELGFDGAAERWEATVRLELDGDADGRPEASGEAIMRLEPRLDWTELRAGANGAFDGLEVVRHPAESPSPDATPYILVGGGGDTPRERFQVNAEGVLYGQGPPAWFFQGAEGPTARISDDDATCYEAILGPLAADYGQMTVRTFLPRASLANPDYRSWVHTETTRYYLYGNGVEQPDFRQYDVLLTAKPGSQIDHDTDGADEGSSPYFYFGAELASSLTARISLRQISDGTATVTPPAETGAEPFEASYGYLRAGGQGHVVLAHAETQGAGDERSVNFQTFVLAVDAEGTLTGDGLLQGYDFPLLDSSTLVGEDEWRAMDNEGLLELGDGLDPALFDFVVTRPSGPTRPD